MYRITVESQAAIIEAWKSRNGVTGRDYVPVNSGVSRTPSKQALLRSLADVSADEGVAPRFSANF